MGGGAEAVALWTLQALVDRYDVTLITLVPINLPRLDDRYGTNLVNAHLTIRTLVPNAFTRGSIGRRFGEHIAESMSLFTLRQYALSRYVKVINDSFDLLICTFNEMDFGRRGIQYIHHPLFGANARRVRSRLNYPDSAIRDLFSIVSGRLFGFDSSTLADNVTLTNSMWTAGLIRVAHGVDAQVVYPPVASDYPEVPWNERRTDLLCISRFVAEKQLHRAIAVTELVRSKGYDVGLTLAGASDGGPYARRIYQLAKLKGDWVSVIPNLDSAALRYLMSSHKYGLHVRRHEQFGIAVAEMVNAGCIPFVPDEGGQTEVVDKIPELMFSSEEDACRKIIQVLDSEARQMAIRGRLSRCSTHSPVEFEQAIARIVAGNLPPTNDQIHGH